MPRQDLIEQGEKRREDMLAFIKSHVAQKGYAPTFGEVGKAVGISSPNSVRSHLARLEDDGYIKMTPNVARSIVLTE